MTPRRKHVDDKLISFFEVMFLTVGNLLLLYPMLNIFNIYINTFVQCPIRFCFYIWMEGSRCAYKCNIILNSVRQHNHLITQGNYKATCFDYRLVIFRRARHALWDKRSNLMYSMDINTMGSQSVHSILWLNWQK